MSPTEQSAAQAGAEVGPTEPDTLLHNVQQLLRELPGLVSDRVHLLALELKRSGLALAQMVGLVVAAGVLLCTAWLALWAGIAAALVELLDLSWGWACLLVVVVNVLAAGLAVWRALSLARFLSLPATLRRLTLSSASVSAARRGADSPASSSTPAGVPDEHAARVAGAS